MRQHLLAPFLRLTLPLLALALLAAPAKALNIEGANLPDTLTIDGQRLVLNGAGLRTFTPLKVKGYVAGLYVAQPSHDAAQILASPAPKVIVLVFLRDASKTEIEKEYRLGETNNCGHGECAPADQAEFEQLIAATPGAHNGDNFMFIFADHQLRAFANGRSLGSYTNPDLAQHFLAGFIGPYPPTPELRAALLGQKAP